MSNQLKGEKKHTINSLDILLIILIMVILAAAIVTVIQSNPGNSTSGDKIITYVISIQMISPDTANQINLGDTIFDNATGQNLGTVQNIEILPVKAIFEGEEIELSDKVDVNITVKASVFENASSYYIGDFRLSSGTEIDFRSSSYMLSGNCLNINI